jgi:ATP-dependent RNA helicase DDX47/RRP3
LDHLENTKGFRLRTKFLVLDEADRLLDLDFGPIITKVLQSVPAERRSLLFSATMPKNVAALVRASLRNPVKISISSSLHQEISTLSQSFLLVPHKHKDIYIVQRLGALSRFKTQGESGRNILVATDVASRGLDLPSVSFVFNYDFPLDSAMYIHRVGRTARAGQSGQAISLVTQYDREMFLRLEHVLQRKIAEFPVVKEEAMVYSERVGEAQKLAARQLRLQSNKSQRRRGGVKRGNGNSRGGNVRGTVRDSMDLDEG